ncbi:Alpha-terpineol synthase, chloroplastic [Cinnamomum micranthum f. kanehirae]|uniref:Alpha-terpineol synthase, chloroplastic n=1 Tax=Cinnamomum micranthum f. kanehirae TaxID=337451 RepID=A0A3S3N9U5_9MAGN|nr:Alpha-terpineol synthase, chloroplastic [Cinnamomum micranthum f. kanehirae]
MSLNLVSPSFPCSPVRLFSRVSDHTPSLSYLKIEHVPLNPKARRKRNAEPPRKCALRASTLETDVARRSANYSPTVWDFDFIQSLTSAYKDGAYTGRVEELKNYVRSLLLDSSAPLARVELINHLQRLGVGYLFGEEIKTVLDTIWKGKDSGMEKDLNATALQFRILRQNGYYASKDVFNSFTDEMGSFKACLCEDTKGLLSLYEASYLAFPGETIMDEAKAFARRHLKNLKGKIDPRLEEQVAHALELPTHYRMLRLEARWYIDMYEKEESMDSLILELAKLDYNILQASYQTDVQNGYRWWRQLGLTEKLPFTRDRWLECYLFSLSITFEPQYGYGREVLNKVNQMITTIDDVYDVYGTVEELELFTDAVDRWDTSAIQQLPEYMKTCFLALLNFGNDLAYDTLKEQGYDVIPYLRKMWADLCKAYLVEARWYHNGYAPTLEEYLRNAWISISGPVVLVHGYFSMRLKVTKEVLQGIENYADLIRIASIILRLCDDMGTSTHELERGDVLKSIQCYMHEANVSEAIAREHVRSLADETWKKMNKEYVTGCLFTRHFADAAIGLIRRAESVYHKGDGFGAPGSEIDGQVTSLVVEPIVINNNGINMGSVI